MTSRTSGDYIELLRDLIGFAVGNWIRSQVFTSITFNRVKTFNLLRPSALLKRLCAKI